MNKFIEWIKKTYRNIVGHYVYEINFIPSKFVIYPCKIKVWKKGDYKTLSGVAWKILSPSDGKVGTVEFRPYFNFFNTESLVFSMPQFRDALVEIEFEIGTNDIHSRVYRFVNNSSRYKTIKKFYNGMLLHTDYYDPSGTYVKTTLPR